MNTRAKGNRNRKKTIDLFESDGWTVSVIERSGRHVKEKDCFGLFDLAAFKGHQIAFVQVTSNRPHSHKKFRQWKQNHGKNVSVIQVVWVDRKGHKFFEY